MRLTGVVLALVLTAGSAAAAQSEPAGRKAVAETTELGPRDVSLTVHYKGAGPVSEKNQVWVFVFDNPNIGGDSEPLDVRAVTANGGRDVPQRRRRHGLLRRRLQREGGLRGAGAAADRSAGRHLRQGDEG